MGALNRFVPLLGEKALPVYRLLKKFDSFRWTDEAQEAFDDLKSLLSTTHALVTPIEGEPMLLYISVSNQAVGVVLALECEEEGHVQKVHRPIYYVSEILTESKKHYPHHQKLIYDVIINRWTTVIGSVGDHGVMTS